MRSSVFVTGSYVGYHRWKDAPEEVIFLRNNHRHKFFWKVTLEVTHDDREIEFFLLQAHVQKFIIGTFIFPELGSCEMQARDIMRFINKKFPGRDARVEVSEDGENGAEVTYEKSAT